MVRYMTRKCWISYNLWLTMIPLVSASDPPGRWGSAIVSVQGGLFVHGGKVDQLNQFSYTSAPDVNDLLYLPLSSTFSVSSPPWSLATDGSQGPAVSWHTLATFNSTQALLLGGLPGPNSQTVLVNQPDSAVLVNLSTIPINSLWQFPPSSWAGQPIRRIRHSMATAPSGKVFIFGGEKADGSQNALAEYFMFDPNVPSFTTIPPPPTNPDVYGHATIALPDGRIILVGGCSPSAGGLLPLTTLKLLDTNQSPPAWQITTTATDNVPSPRMAFASTLLPGNRILIHGGSDSNLQFNIQDGWILDMNASPVTWSQVDALSQIGARRDHFAVAVGNQTIFGFGYFDTGPAPGNLQVFDFSTNSFADNFTPPSASIPSSPKPSSLPIQTTQQTTVTPAPTPTGSPSPKDGANPPGSGGTPGSSGSNTTKKHLILALVLGVVLGVLAVLVIIITAAVCHRRRRQRGEIVASDKWSFVALNHKGDEENKGGRLRTSATTSAVTIPHRGSLKDVLDQSRFTESSGLLSGLSVVGAFFMMASSRGSNSSYPRGKASQGEEDCQPLSPEREPPNNPPLPAEPVQKPSEPDTKPSVDHLSRSSHGLSITTHTSENVIRGLRNTFRFSTSTYPDSPAISDSVSQTLGVSRQASLLNSQQNSSTHRAVQRESAVPALPPMPFVLEPEPMSDVFLHLNNTTTTPSQSTPTPPTPRVSRPLPKPPIRKEPPPDSAPGQASSCSVKLQ